MSHYVLGEEFSVKALAEASGAKPDTVRRYLKKRASGVSDVYCIKARPDGSGKAKPDRWFKTESYEERVAKAAPRFAAAAASYEAGLAGESKCNFPVGLGEDEHPCGDIAPAGQRCCPTHEEAMAVYETRKRRLAARMGTEPDSVSVLDLMVEWDRQRGGHPVGAGRSSWSYYGDGPDPFDGGTRRSRQPRAGSIVRGQWGLANCALLQVKRHVSRASNRFGPSVGYDRHGGNAR